MPNTDDFVRVAHETDIPNRRSKLVQLEGEQIAIWRVDGHFYAVNAVCPHQHITSLHQGTLDREHLTCPMHGWSFSLVTGQAVTGDGCAKVYQVKVERGHILIEKPTSTW